MSNFLTASTPTQPTQRVHAPDLVAWILARRDDSTTDLKQIAAWWDKWPNALPAIDHSKSSLLVLDADRHGPDAGSVVHARIAGRMEKHHVLVSAGDRVRVELSRYDPSRAQIVWRV